MKALVLFFLCFAAPAFAGDGKVVDLTPTIVTTQPAAAVAAPAVATTPAPEVNLLPECADVTEGTTPAGVAGYFAAALLAMRLLAEGLGALAAKGSGSASQALRILSYVMATLGWIAGKMGWGKPAATNVHTMPSLAAAKAPPASPTA